MKKINYTTPYADETINGFVNAEETAHAYIITKAQYNRAIKNLTIGGVAPKFDADKPVLVKGIDC